jgi:hypothetical protein
VEAKNLHIIKMKNRKFKALSINKIWVDPTMLGSGIYARDVPAIFPEETTIMSLIEQAKSMQRTFGEHMVSDAHIKNLAKCNLVTFEMTIQ